MYRITDPEKSRAFYEALGFESRRELPIVRDGELEATNYFFGMPGQEEELELTFNHDGRSYELGSGATATSRLVWTTSPAPLRASHAFARRTGTLRFVAWCLASASPSRRG
jgi:catechol 2,3-dioxygenase-like lactoylglutathione lyase family enzyme